jgi:single-strand DNA-binding protein
MAVRLNNIIMAGNLTGDPSLQTTTKTNTPVTNFRIACNTPAGEGKNRTTFIDCSAFGRLAEVVVQYCKSGSAVIVEGRLDEDTWTTDDGSKRFKHYITVRNIHFQSGPGDEEAKPKADVDI